MNTDNLTSAIAPANLCAPGPGPSVGGTIELPTLCGNAVQLEACDFAVLDRLPGVDMTRLSVIGDEVHAMRRGTNEPQRLSLEQMLAVAGAAPMVAPGPAVKVAEGYAITGAGVMPTVKPAPKPGAKKRAPRGPAKGSIAEMIATMTIPVSGKPSGLLVKSNDRRPWITMDGARVPCPKPQSLGESFRVALVSDTLKHMGWATLDRTAYNRLLVSAHKPDTFMWQVDTEGHATTRVRRAAADPYTQRVDDLLGELGIEARLTLALALPIKASNNLAFQQAE